jgi:hypothetical protein
MVQLIRIMSKQKSERYCDSGRNTNASQAAIAALQARGRGL